MDTDAAAEQPAAQPAAAKGGRATRGKAAAATAAAAPEAEALVDVKEEPVAEGAGRRRPAARKRKA